MTIMEQLQFSVLTAPVATLDRRTLSQAWYSALYGCAANGATAKPASVQAASATSTPEAPLHGAVRGGRCATHEAVAARTALAAAPARADGTPADRRAPRSALARKIERAFLRPRSASHKASFAIEDAGGRVHVLLHSHGSRLKLIAICPPKARPRVAQALAQARYALALRGIDLEAAARSEAPC